MAHEVDGNTIALWRLNEPETGKDYTSAKDDTGWHPLTQDTNGDHPGIVGGPSGTGVTTRFSRWNESGDYFEGVSSFDKERLRRALLGPHTIEAWINLEAIGSDQDIFTWGAVGETVPTNYLERFRVGTTGRLETFWEYNGGINGGGAQTIGTAVSALSWTHVAMVVDGPTRYEKSYAFDGSNEYINVGDVGALSFTFSDPFSVSAWVRKANATFGMIIGKVNSSTDSPALRGWMVNINATGQFEIYLRENGSNGIAVQTTATTFDDDNWYHVVFTYDGSNTVAGLTIYVDGSPEALATTLNAPATTLTNSASVLIGARNTTTLEGPWTGAMTDVAVFDKELSAGEVTELFGRDHPIDITSSSVSGNLLGWWRMGNEPLGTLRRDSLVFGGTDEYVTMGDVSELDFERTDTFSASIWVQATLASEGVLLGKISGQGWYVTMPADGTIWFIVRNTGGGTNEAIVRTTSTGFDDGNWHHIVATYDGSSDVSGMAIYVDGVAVALTTVANTLSATTLTSAAFRLGTTASGAFPLVGSLAEAAVYDKELTAGEVTTIYNKRNPPDLTVTGPTGNLVGYWPLQASPTAPISTVSTAFGGTDEYASVGLIDALNFQRTQAFSISAWIKISTSANTVDSIIGNAAFAGSGWGMLIDWGGLAILTGAPVFVLSDGVDDLYAASSVAIHDGNWHHVVITYDGSSVPSGATIYVDGADVTVTGPAVTLSGDTTSDEPVDIARLFLTLYTEAGIDELALYSVELSSADVTRIYNGGYPTDLLVDDQGANLLAWWRMGDGDTFPILRDSSPNLYHATMFNMESGDFVTNAPGQYPNAYDESSSGNDGVMTNMETTDISRYTGVTQQLFPIIPDESTNNNHGTMLNMEAADLLIDSSIPLCDIEWYVGGVLQDTTADTPMAEGGDAGDFYVLSELNGTTPVVGRCFELKISRVARTGGEISTNAGAANYEHPLDADTEALWRFNEPPETLDVSGNGWHLGPYLFNSDNAPNLPELTPSLIDSDSNSARKFLGYTNGASSALYVPNAQELVPLFMGAAEWTVEFWFLWGDRLLGSNDFITFSSTGESLATNYGFTLQLNASGTIRVFWENGSGSNVEATTTNPVIDATDPSDYNYRHHLAFVKESLGGGNSQVLIYKDGVLLETLGPLADSAGGTSNVLALGGNLDVGTEGIDGTMDDVRVSSIARSASEILASYEAGSVIPGTVTLFFKMRALASPGPGYVTWIVDTTPDFAGTFAPSAIQGGTAVVTNSWEVASA